MKWVTPKQIQEATKGLVRYRSVIKKIHRGKYEFKYNESGEIVVDENVAMRILQEEYKKQNMVPLKELTISMGYSDSRHAIKHINKPNGIKAEKVGPEWLVPKEEFLRLRNMRTLSYIATQFGINRETVYQWIKRYNLPHIRTGSNLRCRMEDVLMIDKLQVNIYNETMTITELLEYSDWGRKKTYMIITTCECPYVKIDGIIRVTLGDYLAAARRYETNMAIKMKRKVEFMQPAIQN